MEMLRDIPEFTAQLQAARLAGDNWRMKPRPGDKDVRRISARSAPGDRVYFDPGPGLRVSGVLKDWKDKHTAIIEVDGPDVGMGNIVTSIMEVPVTR